MAVSHSFLHKEKGWPRAISRLHLNQPRGHRAFLAKHCSHLLQRGRLKQRGQRQAFAELLFYAREEISSKNGMAAQIKEIVGRPYRRHFQYFFPKSG